jgi:hypothetical protein
MLNKLKIVLLKARKEKDTLRVSVLGYLLAEIQNKEIALRGKGEKLTDEHVKEALNKQIKQRKESIEQYKEAKRDDLAEKESSELEVLEELAREYFG